MPALKLLITATTAFFITGVSLVETRLKNPIEPQRWSRASIHVQRDTLVQEHYQAHAKRLQSYYESLLAALKTNAPDLLPLLESPKSLQHGYQTLPRIIADPLARQERPRSESRSYSWPWTDKLISAEVLEIVRSEAQLDGAAALPPAARRSVYEQLARAYLRIRARQQNIDAHIQYNRLWQAAIAANRSAYDRETLLHNAVLERQAILDALNAPSDAAFKKALGGFWPIDRSHRLAETKGGLIERDKLLARDIDHASGSVNTPAFVRVDKRDPNLRMIRVPLSTDIHDDDFVQSVKKIIESIWRLRDGANEFRIDIDVSVVPAKQLYPNQQPPRKGDNIDVHRHIALFPLDRAVLTTGAITTHVHGRAIILGPHDITPRVLAHEFGHILGFKDSYFRGYKDLGKDGFQVMEVVADANDIMGAPSTGPVLRAHFEKILEPAWHGKTPRQDGSF